jgi:Ca2+-binding EF-hand superfamily protein
LYDLDKNGYLDKVEVRRVLAAMLKLLGGDIDLEKLVEETFNELDKSRDGKISKGK